MGKRIRLENPQISMIDLETKAREEVVAKGPKSRAYYRAQATRKMAGKEDAGKAFKKQLQAENDAAKAEEEAEAQALALSEVKKDDGICRVMFDPPHYTVMESVGTFEVTVLREGGDLNTTIQVDYKTEDGTASSEGDYIEAIGTPNMATIMILDDDHSGIFGFEDSEAEIVESVGTFDLKIQRISGARGKVAIPFNTEDGTAKDGQHYEAQEGELEFENEETEKIVSLNIMDEESYEKSLILYVNVGEPRHIAEGKAGEGIDYSILDAKNPEDLTEEEKIALLGRPCLGQNTRIQIRIRESKEFKGAVDKMMQKANNI